MNSYFYLRPGVSYNTVFLEGWTDTSVPESVTYSFKFLISSLAFKWPQRTFHRPDANIHSKRRGG